MTNRVPIIAGNWKMNKDKAATKAFADHFFSFDFPDNVEVLCCPPFIAISDLESYTQNSKVGLGAQNMHANTSGAYTGEISGDFLKSYGCDYVILGHSERRSLFHETDALINEKVLAAFSHGLTPILCVGESLEEREKNITVEIVKNQLIAGLKNTQPQVEVSDIIIAYEPIWAIGTGKVATPEQAQEVHAAIRQTLAEIYNPALAQKIRLQYGGSAKPGNIADLICQPDIDGALVGGACLEPQSFFDMINIISNS